MSALQISDLRHRIDIGQYVTEKDERGNLGSPIWKSTATIWASVEDLRGNQYFQAKQTVDQSDSRITIRYRKDIEQGLIVRHDNREYTIKACLDKDGRKRWLELMCKEVKPA